jgi:aspartate/methionine/tyrosine aminotransferase
VRFDHHPEGTFYAWGNLAGLPEPLNDGMAFFRAVLPEKIITVPGEFFDVNPGKRRSGSRSRFRSYTRFSFGPSQPVLERALDRMERLIARHT